MKARAVAGGALALMILEVLGVWIAPAAQASCAGPTVEVSPSQAPKKAKITISGRFFVDRCNDVVSCTVYTPSPSPGAPSPQPTQTCYSGEPAQGLKDIRIDFVQGGRVWKLGIVDADSDGEIKLEGLVPAGANFGDAKIRACKGDSVCAYPEAKFRVVGVLANTGSNPTGMLVAGLMVLFIGLGLAALKRQARTSA